MRFIRRNGRIIPIREQKEKSMTKQDIKTGFAAGLTNALFFKRETVRGVAGLASFVQGSSTTIKRVKLHGAKKGIWEDIKSSALKSWCHCHGYRRWFCWPLRNE